MPAATSAADISVVATGWRMQNSEMFIGCGLAVAARSRVLGVVAAAAGAVGCRLGHARAVGQAHLPLDDDPLAVLHAGRDRGAVALDADKLDVAHLDRLVVLGDKDERTLLAALDGNGGIITVLGRTSRSISTSTYMPGHSSKFSLANFALAAMVPDAVVDAAVDEIERARRERLSLSPACRRAPPPAAWRADALRRAARSRSGQREADADRLDLRDRHEAGRHR